MGPWVPRQQDGIILPVAASFSRNELLLDFVTLPADLRFGSMSAFCYIFARLYGYTLGRSSRNSPTEACQDAITQLMMIIGVPAICAILYWWFS